METTIYNSPAIAMIGDDPIRKMKSSLTLDLSTRETALTFDGVLSSPDVRMLKLATPELDRLLLQHQAVSGGGGKGGGGRGSAPGHHIWFPKTVTEEQEAYARGFVDALFELHGKREEEEEEEEEEEAAASYLCLSPKISASKVDVFSYVKSLDLSRTRHTSEDFSYSYERDSLGRVIQLPPEVVPPSASVCDSVARVPQHVDPSHWFSQGQSLSDERFHWVTEGVHLKSKENLTVEVKHGQRVHYSSKAPTEWSQSMVAYVPALIGCLSDTPPISPIDMVQQEAIKLARKRARNRLAATRCRNRKLERIAVLQERVDDLRRQNAQLMSTASELRDIVGRVRHEIHTHTMTGCCVVSVAAQQMKFT